MGHHRTLEDVFGMQWTNFVDLEAESERVTPILARHYTYVSCFLFWFTNGFSFFYCYHQFVVLLFTVDCKTVSQPHLSSVLLMIGVGIPDIHSRRAIGGPGR